MKGFSHPLLFLLLLLANQVYSQQSNLYKDCINAMHVCQPTYEFVNFNMTGQGEDTTEVNPNFSCLNTGELNSLWLRFKIAEPGWLGFNITPLTEIDLDWALFDVTNHTCSDIFTNPNIEVACNFSPNIFPTPTTGMNQLPGAPILPQEERMINVLAGQEFVLLINFFHDPAFNPSISFNLDFSIGTCILFGCSKLIGNTFLDENENCLKDVNESAAPFLKLKLVNTEANYTLFANADENGVYEFNYYQGGNAWLSPVIVSELFLPTCNESQLSFNLSGNESLDVGPDVGIKIIGEPCTRLEISNEIPFLRRCFNVYRRIKVCNVGSLPVSEATVQLSYDPEIIPNTSNLPLATIAPNLYEVTLYNIQLFECKTILISDSTSCEMDVLDMGISCVNAEIIAPDNDCLLSDAENLLINVEITCQEPSAYALISNEGVSSLNGQLYMTVTHQSNLIYEGYPVVAPGEQWSVELPDAMHANVFLNAISPERIQMSANPITCFSTVGIPSAAVIRSKNNQVLTCTQVIGSYDPNDKIGFPIGIGAENLISRNIDLHYRIRFQNTGSDTAFTVVVRDTLSPFLDPGSVRLGSTSHSVEFEQQGNVLAFYFKNIMLPDSNTNEPGSIGYLNYYVKQKSSNPEQYEILNNASIYFDFNDAIVTNTHRYTIRPFVPIAHTTLPHTSEILLYPNPANSQVQIVFPNEFQTADLHLFDLSGRIIWQMNAAPNGYILDLHTLKEGIYYIRGMQDKSWMSVSKLVRLGR